MFGEPHHAYTSCDLSAASARYPELMLHDGLFDLPVNSPRYPIPVVLTIEDATISFDLRAVIEAPEHRGSYLAGLSVRQALNFCKTAGLRAELSNGYVFLRRRFPEKSLPDTKRNFSPREDR